MKRPELSLSRGDRVLLADGLRLVVTAGPKPSVWRKRRPYRVEHWYEGRDADGWTWSFPTQSVEGVSRGNQVSEEVQEDDEGAA